MPPSPGEGAPEGEGAQGGEGTPPGGEIAVSVRTEAGDPVVSVETVDSEETLEDGTVVQRRVVRTKQEQLVTTSVSVQGPDGEQLQQVLGGSL